MQYYLLNFQNIQILEWNKNVTQDRNGISAKILCNIFVLCYLDSLYPWLLHEYVENTFFENHFFHSYFDIFFFSAQLDFSINPFIQIQYWLNTITSMNKSCVIEVLCLSFKIRHTDDSITTSILHTFISKRSKSQTN